MNVIESLQHDIDSATEAYNKKITELNLMIEAAKKLPTEILSLNDCEYTYGFVWKGKCDSLSMYFDSDKSIKDLKMMGIQGFKTAFVGEYSCNPDRWMWCDGKIVKDDVEYKFAGGHPPKPQTCRIEEVTETPAPSKKLKAFCNLSGEAL